MYNEGCERGRETLRCEASPRCDAQNSKVRQEPERCADVGQAIARQPQHLKLRHRADGGQCKIAIQ